MWKVIYNENKDNKGFRAEIAPTVHYTTKAGNSLYHAVTIRNSGFDGALTYLDVAAIKDGREVTTFTVTCGTTPDEAANALIQTARFVRNNISNVTAATDFEADKCAAKLLDMLVQFALDTLHDSELPTWLVCWYAQG